MSMLNKVDAPIRTNFTDRGAKNPSDGRANSTDFSANSTSKKTTCRHTACDSATSKRAAAKNKS